MTRNQANINLEEYEEYTEKEIEYIDKYKKISGNTMEVRFPSNRMKNFTI